MTKVNGDGREFKGATQQALLDIRNDITEIKVSMNSLATNFQNLELGRLTKLESTFAQVVTDVGLMKKIVYGIVALVLTGVGAAVLRMVLI